MRVDRRPVLDEYVEDGQSAVMLPDGRVLALSELATTVLHLVGKRGAVGVPEIAAGLVAAFGPAPGDPAGLCTTREVVTQLSDSGLLKVLT